MSKMLPILLVVLGLLGGVAAGVVLKPSAVPCPTEEDGAADPAPEDCKPMEVKAKDAVETAFAELKRQFVVPILKDEEVVALVVASMALEVTAGAEEDIYTLEPKIRDAFLEVLFVHAHSGGFDGDFTSQVAIADLKARLNEAAKPIVGMSLQDVLLT